MQVAVNYRRLLVFLLLLSAVAAVGLQRITLSYDLQFFLPEARNSAQATLLHSLKHGGGSRLLFIGFRPSDGTVLESAALEEAQQLLQDTGLFTSVRSASNEFSLPLEDLDSLQKQRYLLADQKWTESALRQQFQERKADLQYVGGERFNSLFSRDPGLALERLLAAMGPGAANSDDAADLNYGWLTETGFSLLLAESAAPAFDVEKQQLAYREAYERLARMSALDGAEIKIAGVGAISAQVSDVIQGEAMWRSLLASFLLLLVLIVFFRSIRVVLIAGLPLLCSALAGFLCLALLFDVVHGITLAFGFTLLGVAIDYPIHLFNHVGQGSVAGAARRIWPTILLGLLSTVCVYLAMAVAGSTGLVQLGIFTATGLVAAGLSTRYLLPWLMPDFPEQATAANEVKSDVRPEVADASARPQSLSFKPPITALLIAGLVAVVTVFQYDKGEDFKVWNNSLAALSPVAPALLNLDRDFRQTIGAADTSYAIVLESQQQQSVLEKTEELDAILAATVKAGFLGGWTTATRVLPSERKQVARQQRMPGASELRQRVLNAQQGLGFSDSAFIEFLDDAESTRSMPLVSRDNILASPLADYLKSHLQFSGNQWRSVLTLYDLQEVEALAQWLAENAPNASLINYPESAEQLVKQYRLTVLNTLVLMLVIVFALLLFTIRWRRAVWCIACVLVAMFATSVVLLILNASLDLYNLLALLLVLGLGLDYSLFRSRPVRNDDEHRASKQAVAACAASTIVVFTTLAFSDIPALRSLGQGVALGALLCFLLTRLGVRD